MDTLSPAATAAVLSSLPHDLAFTFAHEAAPRDLAVRGFVVEESLCALTRIAVDLSSERADVDLTKLIDRPGLLTVHDRYGQPRHVQAWSRAPSAATAGTAAPSTAWC